MTLPQTKCRCALPALGVFILTVLTVGCGSSPSAEEAAPAQPKVDQAERDDDGAMADLQVSPQWTAVRCRWLETGPWVLAYPQETALYRAAYDLGYIEMEEAGRDNRIGVPETAWRIRLTESGKAEAANCPKQSKSTTWGVPVSRREFIQGTYAGQDAGGRWIYDVEFSWAPTDVGQRVKDVLTNHMTVEEGTYRAKVYMRSGPRQTSPGPNGWSVAAIDDLGAVRLQ